MGDNSDMKKKGHLFFSWDIHIWNFKTSAYMVLNLCYAQESNNIKWPEIAKGHNSNISFSWLKI